MDIDWPNLAVSFIAVIIAVGSFLASRKSANEAAALRRIEDDRRGQERAERHDLLVPVSAGPLPTHLKDSSTGGRKDLFGVITTGRDYRVHAIGWVGCAQIPLGLPLVLRAGKTYEFHIEDWPDGRTEPHTQEIEFRFWPPIEGIDDVRPWSCPCGGPTGETSGGPGHWELRVDVASPPSTPRPFAIW